MLDRLRGRLNERQEKVLLRMFEAGPSGFVGGLSAANYMRITDTPPATTTRDLSALVALGARVRTGDRKSTRYQLPIEVAAIRSVETADIL
jgi:Fic family protein